MCVFVLVGLDYSWGPQFESLVACVVSGWFEGTALRPALIVQHRWLSFRVGHFPLEAEGSFSISSVHFFLVRLYASDSNCLKV